MFLGPYLARTLNETNNLTYLFHKYSFCYINHSIIFSYSNSFTRLTTKWRHYGYGLLCKAGGVVQTHPTESGKKYAKSGHTVEDSIDRHIDFDQWKCGQRVSYFFLSFLQSLLFSTPFFYRDSARSPLYSNFNQVKLLEFYSWIFPFLT